MRAVSRAAGHPSVDGFLVGSAPSRGAGASRARRGGARPARNRLRFRGAGLYPHRTRRALRAPPAGGGGLARSAWRGSSRSQQPALPSGSPLPARTRRAMTARPAGRAPTRPAMERTPTPAEASRSPAPAPATAASGAPETGEGMLTGGGADGGSGSGAPGADGGSSAANPPSTRTCFNAVVAFDDSAWIDDTQRPLYWQGIMQARTDFDLVWTTGIG